MRGGFHISDVFCQNNWLLRSPAVTHPGYSTAINTVVSSLWVSGRGLFYSGEG